MRSLVRLELTQFWPWILFSDNEASSFAIVVCEPADCVGLLKLTLRKVHDAEGTLRLLHGSAVRIVASLQHESWDGPAESVTLTALASCRSADSVEFESLILPFHGCTIRCSLAWPVALLGEACALRSSGASSVGSSMTGRSGTLLGRAVCLVSVNDGAMHAAHVCATQLESRLVSLMLEVPSVRLQLVLLLPHLGELSDKDAVQLVRAIGLVVEADGRHSLRLRMFDASANPSARVTTVYAATITRGQFVASLSCVLSDRLGSIAIRGTIEGEVASRDVSHSQPKTPPSLR